MCDKCMSLKPDKTPGMELKVRCSLCVEQNITVLAKTVEFTANGIKSKVANSSQTTPKESEKRNHSDLGLDGNQHQNQVGKAADSILKWGGGHAKNKKQLKKMKRWLCQFGADCIRHDCFFFHPERKSTENSATT